MSYSRRDVVVAGAALASASALATEAAQAAVNARDVDYIAGGDPMEGFLAFDESIQGKRPGILVMHTRRGIGAFVKERTEELAKMGYVAFAADIFGKGVRPVEDGPAGVQSTKFRKDRPLTRLRAQAAFDLIRQHPLVDGGRIGTIGYCLGGMIALELARDGAPLLGVGIFHGTLDTPTPRDAKNIKGRALVMTGAEDPVIKQEEVAAFVKEMRDAKVDFQLEMYGSVVHGFTEKHNGNDPSRGSAYNERADKLSWAAMSGMFQEVFQR